MYSGVFGSNESASNPTNGGTVDAAITYIRRFGTFRVYNATARKIQRDNTAAVSVVVLHK
jgi:hypothetical protein